MHNEGKIVVVYDEENTDAIALILFCTLSSTQFLNHILSGWPRATADIAPSTNNVKTFFRERGFQPIRDNTVLQKWENATGCKHTNQNRTQWNGWQKTQRQPSDETLNVDALNTHVNAVLRAMCATGKIDVDDDGNGAVTAIRLTNIIPTDFWDQLTERWPAGTSHDRDNLPDNKNKAVAFLKRHGFVPNIKKTRELDWRNSTHFVRMQNVATKWTGWRA